MKGKKGQSLVETALIMPIILLILVGIIDFGMLFNNYILVNNAAREGARNAAVGDTDDEIKQIVTDAAGTLDTAKLTITITPDQYHRDPGDSVVVTVGYDYSMITPLISAIIPGPIHLTGKSVMHVE